MKLLCQCVYVYGREGSICVGINGGLWYNMYAIDYLLTPSPNAYIKALITRVMVFGGEGFGRKYWVMTVKPS